MYNSENGEKRRRKRNPTIEVLSVISLKTVLLVLYKFVLASLRLNRAKLANNAR